VFSMKEILECDPEEICITLGLNKADYWQCMSRARKQIQLCLNENWFGGGAL
jgi:RNA polymerase sigma-70 factor, ECF subfamily